MTAEYYKTKESVEEYIRMAEDVDSKLLIEELQQVLPPESTVLELGSGPGTDWNILSDSYNTIGSDNSTEFLNHLIQSNPKGTFLELDAITIETDLTFDGIYSNKVMHHLNDNELLLSVNRQNDLLNPNGIICHSFWKGEGSEIFKGLFVNYHGESRLKDFFGDYFEILSIKSYKEFEDDDSLLLIGKKK